MFSASAAQRVEYCPASEVLPQVFNESAAANKGSAGHEHMALRASHGVDYAVEHLDATIAKHNLDDRDAGTLRARLLKFEWIPPAGALQEIRLALMEDWSVIRVPADQRYYPGAIFTGQFDLCWSEPNPLIFEGGKAPRCPADSVLWVPDWKFGKDSWVHTVEANLQLAIYTYLAARWTGARQVVPATIFPSAGQGDWDVPEAPWGERELTAIEERIKRLLAGVERNKLRLANGEHLEYTEGRHCEFCPARSHCAAKTAMYKRVFDEGVDTVVGDAVLTPEQARYAAIALPQFARFARELREVLENYVREHGPIPVDDDGVVYGPKNVEKDAILSGPARAILVEELGDEYAEIALKAKMSKSSVEEAVRALHEHQGIKRRLKPTMGRILGKLRNNGALVTEPSVEWCAHRPVKALPQQAIDPEVEDL